jgi:hypothetical protein
MDRFIERSLRRRVHGPVEARVARTDRCRDDESGERSLIGEASPRTPLGARSSARDMRPMQTYAG